MYTRCTRCRTVFHITVAELRAADGRVVCGQCDAEFDALDNLTDSLPSANEESPPGAEGDETGDKRRSAGDARDEDEFLREIESLIVDDDGDGLPAPDEVFRIDEGRERHERVVIAEIPGWELADEDEVADAPLLAGRSGGKERRSGKTAATRESAPDEETDDKAAETPTDPDPLSLPETSPAGSRRVRLVAATVVLLLLAAAWAHLERGRLLRHPAGQAILAPVYSALGVEASPDWSPDDLKVLRSATVADPKTPGSLTVMTEFRNAAGFAQPYPVLRVTLEDRWGQKVSSEDFAPGEYLETPVAGRRMAPGERVQTTVSLPDPGAGADGFRVDLCLEGRDRRLQCAVQRRP